METDIMIDKKLLKYCGSNVHIGDMVKIVNPDKIEIDDNTRIDDFSIIVGGQGLKIGKFVHIASFVSIIGGGIFEMGDFSGISAGGKMITGSDDYTGRCLTNPMTPLKYRPYAHRGFIKIGKHAILGTNTVVHPDIEIPEGCATGSFTLVNKSLEAWKMYFGIPAKYHKDRQKETILEMEKQLLKEHGY